MSNRPRRTLRVTWAQVHDDARRLAAELAAVSPSLGPWKGIVALARGGLVPAAVVARALELRLVETLCVASYTDRTQEGVRVLKPPAAALGERGKGWLMIDDLVDTGATARCARELLPQAHFATLYAKPDGEARVDTFLHPVAQDTWVVFPWDDEGGEDGA